jgi:hypothetical protein
MEVRGSCENSATTYKNTYIIQVSFRKSIVFKIKIDAKCFNILLI